ncbi:hypothetical protein BD626DRAFT_498095 [Schizophyllum amplum]|uniref:Uncharacterized protein n=1 Tax=Schizophyllum amplum TaxID=97359 RepID=A0A550CD18_9AGAR|nr:hypothetical protein BD626DRAFT_498095 [Auriculariopsis ampla]
MSSGSTANDPAWKGRENAEEAQHIHAKEQEQLKALRAELDKKDASAKPAESKERDFEGGFGGQEHLEDRYATTSGEH